MHITYPAYVFPLFAVPSYLTIGKDNIWWFFIIQSKLSRVFNTKLLLLKYEIENAQKHVAPEVSTYLYWEMELCA